MVWGGRVSLLGTPWVCQGEGSPGSVQAHGKKNVCCEWVGGDSCLQGEVVRMFSQGWLWFCGFFTVIASRMLSLLSLLHGLLLENARVVSAIPAATLAAQLPGRNRKLLHVHDISSKTTCLMQETAFPRAGHSPWGRIAVLVDRVMFLPQCHHHSNSCVVTEQAGSSCPFPAGCWYKPAGFHSSGPTLFHRSTRHTGSQAGVRLCSQATSDRMGGHSLKWH